MTKFIKQTIFLLTISTLAACNTVAMPDLPGMSGSVDNVGAYPKAAEAPRAPIDIRSDEEWDVSANEVIAARDSFVSPGKPQDGFRNDAEIEAEMKALKIKVEEYKLDDPVE